MNVIFEINQSKLSTAVADCDKSFTAGSCVHFYHTVSCATGTRHVKLKLLLELFVVLSQSKFSAVVRSWVFIFFSAPRLISRPHTAQCQPSLS